MSSRRYLSTETERRVPRLKAVSRGIHMARLRENALLRKPLTIGPSRSRVEVFPSDLPYSFSMIALFCTLSPTSQRDVLTGRSIAEDEIYGRPLTFASA